MAKTNRVSSFTITTPVVTKSNYVYVFELTDYNAHKAIHMLQSGGAMVQSAFRPFTALIDGKTKSFGYGSVVLPVNLQNISPDSLYRLVCIPLAPATTKLALIWAADMYAPLKSPKWL
jgi:hypothetical protein